MNCAEIKRKYAKEFQKPGFDHCPGCGVYAPWAYLCYTEEKK